MVFTFENRNVFVDRNIQYSVAKPSKVTKQDFMFCSRFATIHSGERRSRVSFTNALSCLLFQENLHVE
jgi:hypothetical protein